jgi:sulfotransferase family protein
MALETVRRRLFRGRRSSDRPPAPFVVGVSRSGTTLLRLMLDAHPELTIPAETHFVPMVANVCDELVKEGASSEAIRERALETMTSHPRWGDFLLDPEDVKARMEQHDPITTGDAIRAFYEAAAAQQGKPRWGDKSPPYTYKAPRIQAALPEAHFVHIIRDGRDVALSLSEVSWGTDDITEAAKKWVKELRKARKRSKELARGTYMEVHYEDLVADPEPVLRRITGHVDLPWSDEMLDYPKHAQERMRGEMERTLKPLGGGTITAEERTRQHKLLFEPPAPSRASRWRTDMSEENRRAFEAVAGPLLKKLGYEVES